MAKAASVTLDGILYSVPALNIGQLEEVAVCFEGQRTRIPFDVLRIALKRCEPPVDMNAISPTMDEVGAAVAAILESAGLKADKNPPQAPQLMVVPND